MSEQAIQASTQQNQKANSDHHPENKSLKQSNTQVGTIKHQNSSIHQPSETDKKSNSESIGNQYGGINHIDHLNQSSNNSVERIVGPSQYDSGHHQNQNQIQLPSKQQQHLSYQRTDYGHYYGNSSHIQFCKNHSAKEATKICLHAGCALTREICDSCEKQPPHSNHPQSIVDAKKFFVDVELGLKEFRMNSPLMNASEMLEQGRQFILRHFQSMNNMLVEKSHKLVTILALIEQTESAKRTPMKTYELERFIRDVMDIFQLDKSGKLESHKYLQTLDQDIVKEEISSVLFMIRDLENVVRLLHDDFAKALKFGDYGYYAGMERNSSYNNRQSSHHRHGSTHSINNQQVSNTIQNGGEVREHSKSISEQGGKSANCNQLQGGPTQNSSHISQPNSYPHNFDKNHNNLMHPKDGSSLNQQGGSKNWVQSQFHPTSYHTDMDIEGGSLNQKNKSIQLGSSSLISTNQFNADVLMDPAFLKRPRGRPKGSKCKRKGKYKGKYTDEEKLQILQEVGKSKSVQVVAEKYSIQNSLIRYWARQLKYELDPQTVSSRRPYRTFSREQKKIIVQEAIKRRDIVLVAQEYDVNAQVLKRWILKSAQGALQSQEMRQMMNAVPNIGGEDDDDQSGDDSDLHSDEDDDDDEDEDDDDEDMGDDEDENVDEQFFGRQNNRSQENDSSNNQLQYKQSKKGISPTQKAIKKVIEPIESRNNSNSFHNLYQQHQNGQDQNDLIKQRMEQFQKEINTYKMEEIDVKDEDTNSEHQSSLALKIQKQIQLKQKQEDKENKKRKKSQIEDEDDSDEDSEEESDEEEDDYSSSQNVNPSKKVKGNDEGVKDQIIEINNDNKQSATQIQNNNNSKESNKNSLKMIDSNVNEILNFDVLKTIDLKNLDLNMDTQAQSEKLLMMQKVIEEELSRIKQQQQENKLKKQISEQKKQINIVKASQQQQTQK